MSDIFFDNEVFGQIARDKMKKMSGGKDLDPNFRLYIAGWIENGPPEAWDALEVTGAVLREAKSGPSKGKLRIPVPGTKLTAIVTKSEMEAFEKGMAE